MLRQHFKVTLLRQQKQKKKKKCISGGKGTPTFKLCVGRRSWGTLGFRVGRHWLVVVADKGMWRGIPVWHPSEAVEVAPQSAPSAAPGKPHRKAALSLLDKTLVWYSVTELTVTSFHSYLYYTDEIERYSLFEVTLRCIEA